MSLGCNIMEKTKSILIKIRERQSYAKFKELLLFLRNKPDEFTVLRRIHSIIDDYRGFHSERNSLFALESLGQLENDYKSNPFPRGEDD